AAAGCSCEGHAAARHAAAPLDDAAAEHVRDAAAASGRGRSRRTDDGPRGDAAIPAGASCTGCTTAADAANAARSAPAAADARETEKSASGGAERAAARAVGWSRRHLPTRNAPHGRRSHGRPRAAGFVRHGHGGNVCSRRSRRRRRTAQPLHQAGTIGRGSRRNGGWRKWRNDGRRRTPWRRAPSHECQAGTGFAQREAGAGSGVVVCDGRPPSHAAAAAA
ncbi:hypothetical protein PMAYCL1PPCAC_11391, partial [Pristionchus mayeri]